MMVEVVDGQSLLDKCYATSVELVQNHDAKLVQENTMILSLGNKLVKDIVLYEKLWAILK